MFQWIALALVVGTARGSVVTACTSTGSPANTATVSGITDTRVGCAMFYNAAYVYLGVTKVVAGTPTITSAAFAALPTQVELYSANCGTYYSYYACPVTAPPPAPIATPASTIPPVASTASPTVPTTSPTVPTTGQPTVTLATPTMVPVQATAAVPTTTPQPSASATAQPTTQPTSSLTSQPTTTLTGPPTTSVTAQPTVSATVQPSTSASPPPTTPVTTQPPATVTAQPTASVTVTSPPTTSATPQPTTSATPQPSPSATAPAITTVIAPPLIRAMYSWGAADCLVGAIPSGATSYAAGCPYDTAEEDQAAFFYRLANPLRAYPPFNRVYLEVSLGLLTNSTGLVQGLLATAHAQGIAVELLGGDDTWMAAAAATSTPLALCAAVVAFNADAPVDARFDGVHLDLEPQGLPGWTANTTTANGTDPYNDNYEGNLLAILRGCKGILSGTGTTLAWDAAAFYARWATDVWTPLVRERLVDYVAVMNYFNTEATFLGGSGGTGGVGPVLASLMGAVPAVFVADVSDPSLGDVAGSFWAIGSAPLEATLHAAVAGFANASGFAGVAVQPLGDYVYLQPTGPPLAPSCSSVGRAITFVPDRIPVGSLAIYNSKTWAYLGFVNVNSAQAGSLPYNVTASKSVAAGYLLEVYDGPNLTRALVDSIVYDVPCTISKS